MIPRIKQVIPQKDYVLKVIFDDRKIVLYDVKKDIETIPDFSPLKEVYRLFEHVQLDSSRTGIFWNDVIDLPSHAIYEYGKEIKQK